LGRVEKALALIEADMLRRQRLEPSLTYSKPKTQNSKLKTNFREYRPRDF